MGVTLRGILARAACCAVLLLPACTYATGRSTVLVTSEPEGAEILVDGEVTGLTTPATLPLDGPFGSSHVITVRKTGFEPEDRPVSQRTSTGFSRWVDGVATDPRIDVTLWPVPVFWTTADFLTPFKLNWQYVPNEIYVRLHREGTAPQRFVPED